jgi:ABC-2 type transport system ATP-binding protein
VAAVDQLARARGRQRDAVLLRLDLLRDADAHGARTLHRGGRASHGVEWDTRALAEHAIRIQDLRVVRGGTVVLPGLSAEVATGSVTGLLGPSGSGKTTLIRSIVGVQIVAGGSVEVLGRPAGSPALRVRVGYMTQAPSVYGDLTVRENLRFFARVLDHADAAVERALGDVSLEPHGDQVVNTLSGGERARVSLATALLGEPDLLVLDEPTVGLDPVLRRDLWALFHRLADRGTTLLVSSHVMDEADRCDELLLLREGRLLAQAAPAELRARTGEQDLDAAFLRLVEDAS